MFLFAAKVRIIFVCCKLDIFIAYNISRPP